MQFLKKYLKFIIGIAVLIMALVVFACTMKTTDNLETGTLKDWQKASIERRTAAVRIIVASDENLDLLVACIDKISTMPDALGMNVRDAAALCNTGIQLKANL
ncbi:MAG: hypothetical protein K2M34_00025 [Alphaproteobacteria bacterium]|nr:hypothetical protein [Alphaproteobacteria bacterium]